MSSAIDRRDFLHSAGASVAAFRMLRAASLVPSADSNERSGRLVYSLNRNWRFSSKRFENDTTLGFDSEFVSIYRASSATCGAIRPEPWPFPFKGQRNSSEKIPLASLEAAELYGSAQKSSPAKQHSALRPRSLEQKRWGSRSRQQHGSKGRTSLYTCDGDPWRKRSGAVKNSDQLVANQ